MSQQSKNRQERVYAEHAASLLQENWILGYDRESPDFIVTDRTKRFGLEVTFLFSDAPASRITGSSSRKNEVRHQKFIDKYRKTFEKKSGGGVSLDVKFLGDINDKNMTDVVTCLLGMNLQNWGIGDQSAFSIPDASRDLQVFVTRAINPRWYYLNDRVGWVIGHPEEHIAKAIDLKARKLVRYRINTGIDDIRLLLVADRIMNSGKLTLSNEAAFEFRGFQAVYFLSYPDNVFVLKKIGATDAS